MARIRTIKPGYHKHKKVRQVGRDARLLNIGLWNLADDEGRLQELPNSIIGEIFPTDDDVTPVVLREWLQELHEAGLIIRYEVDGEDYLQSHDFNDHQVINKPRPSEIPPPPEPNRPDSGSPPVVVPDDSHPEEEKEEEKEGERENGTPATSSETQLADSLIRAFNVEAHTRFSTAAWLDDLVRCFRAHPELTETEHLQVIRAAFASQWWKREDRTRQPSPGVIWGSEKQFDRCLQEANSRRQDTDRPSYDDATEVIHV